MRDAKRKIPPPPLYKRGTRGVWEREAPRSSSPDGWRTRSRKRLRKENRSCCSSIDEVTPGCCSAASAALPCGVRIAAPRSSIMLRMIRCAAITAIIGNGHQDVALSAAESPADGSGTGRSRSKLPLGSSLRIQLSQGWIATPPEGGRHTDRSSKACSRDKRRFLSGHRWGSEEHTSEL